MRLDPSKKYIHQFNSENEYNEYAFSSAYTEPFVATCVPMEEAHDDKLVKYNKTEKEKLLEMPLTFEILSNGNISWKAQNTAYTCTIEYKKNDGEWTSITSATGSSAPSISVVAGDILQFRGDNATYSSNSSSYNTFSDTTCQFNVKGNIMSLINSTDFATITTLQSAYTFMSLFRNCMGLTSAGNLVLLATTLTYSCYSYMFYGCTSLTEAPELPATTLAEYCYIYMFYGCTSLTTAPELPATTLANGCYNGMFYDCTSLTTAPDLPATTLAVGCYYHMFSNCTSLRYIKCLATSIPSGEGCTLLWTYNVASTGTFIKASSMNDWTTGNSGIPSGWTVYDE